MNKYKPSKDLFDTVEPVVLKLMTKKLAEHFTEDGKLRLKPAYEALEGKVSYDEIRLCMLYI